MLTHLLRFGLIGTAAFAFGCSSGGSGGGVDGSTDSATSRDATWDVTSKRDAASDGGSVRDASLDAAPACQPTGTPGALCAQGDAGGNSGTYTWWFYTVTSLTSLDWTVNIDKTTGDDGYFWSHEFYFADGGGGGYVGIQDNGVFQTDLDAATEVTPMVLFSAANGVLEAGLGTVAEPNGAVLPGFDPAAYGNIPNSYSIHVKYTWTPCRTYHFRLYEDGNDGKGNTWFAASVEDTTTKVVTVIGRMLFSGGVGGIIPETVNWTERFDGPMATLPNCTEQEHASAVFWYPVPNVDAAAPTYTNDFSTGLHCANARFTVLPEGIRQEMGVPLP